MFRLFQHRRRPYSHFRIASFSCTSTKIHSFKSFWNSFFFSFFCTQKNYKKLQKAPLNRPVVTSAVGKLANPEWVTSTKQLSHISYKYRCMIHSSAYDAALMSTWSQKELMRSLFHDSYFDTF